MSTYVSTHALERSVRALSTDGVLSLDQLRSNAGYDQLQEIETQLQIPIWGTARDIAGWSTFPVTFDVQFIFAPEQRDSPLAVPHFSFGPVVSGVPSPDGTSADPNNPNSLVAISCQVVEWAKDHAIDAIVGAVIGIGVSTLGGNVEIDFNGYVHLTFQGYGQVQESSVSTGGSLG